MTVDRTVLQAAEFTKSGMINNDTVLGDAINVLIDGKATPTQAVQENLFSLNTTATIVSFAASGADSDWWTYWRVPPQFSGSTATVHAFLVGDVDPAGNTVIDPSLDYSVGSDGAAFPADSTATRTTDATNGLNVRTADYTQIRHFQFALTGLAAGKVVRLRWRRLGSTGTDTYAQTCSGVGFAATYNLLLATA